MNTPSIYSCLSRREFLGCLGAGVAGCALADTPAGAAPGGENLREASFYEPLDGDRVLCKLCPRGCVVGDKQRGYCRVRENRGGRYYSLVYGRPCALHTDPIEKKPFFHVYPGSKAFSIATVGCNMACKFCQNWDISQAGPDDIQPPYQSPEAIAQQASTAGTRTIAYTYTEPTIFFEYMADCAKAGKARGIESVVVSNGFITAEAQTALFPLVKAIKIDFKAFTPSFYRDTCDGFLEPVKESLRRLAKSGVWYEIVVLLIPTLNDSTDEIKRMTAWIVKDLSPDVPLHFSRYHPMYKIKNIPPTPPDTLRRARQIAVAEGCRFVYIGNIPGEEAQNTICPYCQAMLIRRYEYRILENNIVKGTCRACGKTIAGVWE
ncbi:MAG: AmmeMemoRadiSam system radical SAM enzyme [Kiritimatiellae bacterium]|nr:AmmeMemoRadiSam system radical SAM enzyme [Kiritimatiellia bacterium]